MSIWTTEWNGIKSTCLALSDAQLSRYAHKIQITIWHQGTFNLICMFQILSLLVGPYNHVTFLLSSLPRYILAKWAGSFARNCNPVQLASNSRCMTNICSRNWVLIMCQC